MSGSIQVTSLELRCEWSFEGSTPTTHPPKKIPWQTPGIDGKLRRCLSCDVAEIERLIAFSSSKCHTNFRGPTNRFNCSPPIPHAPPPNHRTSQTSRTLAEPWGAGRREGVADERQQRGAALRLPADLFAAARHQLRGVIRGQPAWSRGTKTIKTTKARKPPKHETQEQNHETQKKLKSKFWLHGCVE